MRREQTFLASPRRTVVEEGGVAGVVTMVMTAVTEEVIEEVVIVEGTVQGTEEGDSGKMNVLLTLTFLITEAQFSLFSIHIDFLEHSLQINSEWPMFFLTT